MFVLQTQAAAQKKGGENMPRKLFTHTCDYCGVSFMRNKKKVEGRKIFCSSEHATIGQTRNYAAPYSKSKEYPKGAKCSVCLIDFYANNVSHIYCSNKCRFTARNERTKEKWKKRKVVGVDLYDKDRYAVKSALIARTKNCPICNVDFSNIDIKSIHLDHNHSTGKVRGVLCFKCNAGLGQFNDSIKNLKAAVKYLEKELKQKQEQEVKSCAS